MENYKTKKITLNDLTKVNNDVNGNPRYVLHFSQLITDKDEKEVITKFKKDLEEQPLIKIGLLLNHAVKKAKEIGGKRYRSKDFGGGIVFQSYNTHHLIKQLNELL